MKAAIKKAAGLTAARKNKLHNEHYQKGKPLSSLKEQIGEFLLLFQYAPLKGEFCNKFWQCLNSMLQAYYGEVNR